MRKLIVPFMFAATAVASPPLFAHAADHPDGAMPPRMEHFIDHLLDKVDATAAQRTQIEQIIAGYHPKLKSLHQQMFANHKAEHALDPMASDYIDQAYKLVDERSALLSQAGKLHAQMRQEIAGVLSPEQRAKLKAAEAKMAQRFRERHRRLAEPPVD